MDFFSLKNSSGFSVEALFQIFDLVKGLMHPNSKIFDFVNLTAEIVDIPLQAFSDSLSYISRFRFCVCLIHVIQFSRYSLILYFHALQLLHINAPLRITHTNGGE